MSQFPMDANSAVSCEPIGDGDEWRVGFARALALQPARLHEIGSWIADNVAGGGILNLPYGYLFRTEEDALLCYLRFK